MKVSEVQKKIRVVFVIEGMLCMNNWGNVADWRHNVLKHAKHKHIGWNYATQGHIRREMSRKHVERKQMIRGLNEAQHLGLPDLCK